jgi:hypothetical protein
MNDKLENIRKEVVMVYKGTVSARPGDTKENQAPPEENVERH